MGIDPVHIINHKLAYKKPEEFISKLKVATGFDIFIGRIAVTENVEEIRPPENFTGWVTYLEDNETLEERELNNESLKEYFLHNNTDDNIDFYVNPYCFELNGEPFYMGRWFQVKYMADFIKEHGIPDKKYYENENADFIFRNRKNLFEYAQQFGTTAMVTFCYDKHQEWLDLFIGEKWTIEQFVAWGKKELIYVEFQDLIHFNFPENNPEHYNVFIYDDFRDLK